MDFTIKKTSGRDSCLWRTAVRPRMFTHTHTHTQTKAVPALLRLRRTEEGEQGGHQEGSTRSPTAPGHRLGTSFGARPKHLCPCVYFPAWQAVLRDQKCTLMSGNLRASVVKPKPAPSEGRKICSSLGKMDILKTTRSSHPKAQELQLIIASFILRFQKRRGLAPRLFIRAMKSEVLTSTESTLWRCQLMDPSCTAFRC